MKRAYTLFLKDILEAMEKIEQFVGETSFEVVKEELPALRPGIQEIYEKESHHG